MDKALKKITATISLTASLLYSASISDYVDVQQCDFLIDKQVFEICYNKTMKGADAVWYTLNGDKVNAVNIKKRSRFYSEKNLPVQYRSKYKDYTHSGFDRGHLAPDADFDYSEKALRKTYTMANIVPQYPKLNRKTWAKAERYERSIAAKLGSVTVVNKVLYNQHPQKIGKNGIAVPDAFVKILFNDKEGFERCLFYENTREIDTKKDKLKSHIVGCKQYRVTK